MLTKPSKRFQLLLGRVGCGLTELRRRKGFNTIKDFAMHHQLPFIQYWRIEKGKANITLKTLVTLLTIHGVSIDDFFELVRTSC